MNEEARELVKQLLQEGRRYDDVRRALISHGHSTEGFENEYPVIQKELGIKEPPPTAVAPQPMASVRNDKAEALSERRRALDVSNFVQNIVKLAAGVLVIVVAVIVFSGYGSTLKAMLFGAEERYRDISAESVVHESNLRAMQASANAYRAKLTDYAGLCTSIGIDREVYSCKENTESYVIEVPLQTGAYYCVDSTGFSGETEGPADGRYQCNE